MYRIVTKFETIYTHEQESKIEFTNDLASAKRIFALYMKNPEVILCSIDIAPKHDDDTKLKIIAVYKSI